MYRVPGSLYGTTDPIMGDYDPTAEFETIQNPTAVQYAAADIHSHPMSTPSPSGPYYASGLIYLTEDHAVGALPVPAANEYHDLGAEFGDMVQTPGNVQLGSAQIPPTTPQSAQVSCPWALCLWRDESICAATISCEDVPGHFKDVHNIKKLNEFVQVNCKWEGCSARNLGRKNIVRHIRECHLKHSRKNGHSA